MHQFGIREVNGALLAASEAVSEQQERLRGLLDQASREMVAKLGDLRRVRSESMAIGARLDETEARLALHRSSELAEEIVDLREKQQALRQSEQRLLESVDDWRACARRLGLALQTGDAVVAVLLPETPVPDSGLLGTAAWRVAQAQEDERQRLSREIHDGPAQALANVIFELEFCERLLDRDPEKLRQELARLKFDMRQALADVRHFIFGLRPAGLGDVGLAAIARRYAEDYANRCRINVCLDIDESLRLSPNEEVAVFRIIQEALQNTRKHGKATELRLQIRAEDEGLVLRIEDDGEGFDMSKIQTVGHFGIRGMQERAQLIGAKLEIESKPGSGTKVTLVVPEHNCE